MTFPRFTIKCTKLQDQHFNLGYTNTAFVECECKETDINYIRQNTKKYILNFSKLFSLTGCRGG